MEEALNVGARRRSLAAAALATPVTGKRAWKKSPVSTGTTVTPDAKRHMSESGSTDEKASSSKSAAGLAAVPPVELFPAPSDAPEKPLDDVDATQIDLSPVGWVIGVA